MRLRRPSREPVSPSSPTEGLEFDVHVPEGLEVRRGRAGADLTISAGEPDDPRATVISFGAARDGGAGPLSLDQHVARVRPTVTPAGADALLVDEAPVRLAGRDGRWTMQSVAFGGRAYVVDRWMLVRDGVGWTVTVQMPWESVHRLRDGALAVVGSLAFHDGDAR